MFQSTLPHGERHTLSGIAFKGIRFQSTLPHGERLADETTTTSAPAVSIHAPAWGATVSV